MQQLEIGKVFLHEIPESRLRLWSEYVRVAVLMALKEEKPSRKSNRNRRGGRRGRNARRRADL